MAVKPTYLSQQTVSQRTAIVIGGTGLVGVLLIEALLNSSRYHTIYQVVRHPVKVSSGNTQLQSIVVPDFAGLDNGLLRLDLNQADAFSTLGTTLKQAGGKHTRTGKNCLF